MGRGREGVEEEAGTRANEATGTEGQVAGATAAGWWATEDQLIKASGQDTKGPGSSGVVSYAVLVGAAIAGASIYASGKGWVTS